MFKFLADIKELKRDVKEIFDEFNEDRVSNGWFTTRRTLRKRVDDLETIVDKLLGQLKLEANEVAKVPEVPSTWKVSKASKKSKRS